MSGFARHTSGAVLHGARLYDLLAWLITGGRERLLRQEMLRLARIAPGERVLDVGCGTGTLAIAAKRAVGATGAVHGIDASPAMIARASRKAAKAGLDVAFETAAVEALPFPDARFDVVLSTLMLHHLGRKARQQCAREIRRVLQPDGRVLAVDFGAAPKKRGVLAHFHRHGHVDIGEIAAIFGEAGLKIIERGAVGLNDLQFVLAASSDLPVVPAPVTAAPPDRPQWARAWIPAATVTAIVAGHAVVPFVLSHIGVSLAVVSGAAALVVVMHLGVASAALAFVARFLRRQPRD